LAFSSSFFALLQLEFYFPIKVTPPFPLRPFGLYFFFLRWKENEYRPCSRMTPFPPPFLPKNLLLFVSLSALSFFSSFLVKKRIKKIEETKVLSPPFLHSSLVGDRPSPFSVPSGREWLPPSFLNCRNPFRAFPLPSLGRLENRIVDRFSPRTFSSPARPLFPPLFLPGIEMVQRRKRQSLADPFFFSPVLFLATQGLARFLVLFSL